ncbi:MAG: hypothetical protein ABI352_00590 [Candidatus Dormibacter sp.]
MNVTTLIVLNVIFVVIACSIVTIGMVVAAKVAANIGDMGQGARSRSAVRAEQRQSDFVERAA